jgi:hypothetical protein
MERLVRHLDGSAVLRAELDEAAALATLMVLTSYSAFRELGEEGLDEAAVATTLELFARQLLLTPGR